MIYHLKLQPSEIENMDYYEYHYFVKDMTKVLKDQEKGNTDQSQQAEDMKSQMKMPSMKMPSVKMPSMPKM